MNCYDEKIPLIAKEVFDIVARIPLGKVMTYGQIARLLNIKSPRQIGYILHRNPNPKKYPCHRVINSKGEISSNFAFGGPNAQLGMLQKEGIIFQKNKTDLTIYRYEI